MATTRVNEKGNLEVLHPPTQSYIPAFAPLQSSGGSQVSLISSQAVLLSNINTLLTDSKNISESQRGTINSILTSLEDSSAGVKKHLRDVLTYLTTVTTKQSDAIQALVNLQNTLQQQNPSSSVPKIFNIQLAANTESSFIFPAGTKKLSWKCRANDSDTTASIKYSYESGKVTAASITSGATGYYVLSEGQEEVEDDLRLLNSLTIYFASSVAVWLSIKYWS